MDFANRIQEILDPLREELKIEVDWNDAQQIINTCDDLIDEVMAGNDKICPKGCFPEYFVRNSEDVLPVKISRTTSEWLEKKMLNEEVMSKFYAVNGEDLCGMILGSVMDNCVESKTPKEIKEKIREELRKLIMLLVIELIEDKTAATDNPLHWQTNKEEETA